LAQPEDDAPEGAPEWMVTYSDMISLLVTFFILLMTFSSQDDDDEFPIKGQMLGMGGTFPKAGHTMVEPPQDDIMTGVDVVRGKDTPHTRPKDKLDKSLDEMGQKPAPEYIEFNLRAVNDGIVLVFDAASSFLPGSDAVGPKLRTALADLAEVLEHYDYRIVVEGFTDDAFKPSPSFPTAEALSVARASAAADVMLSASSLSPMLVQVAGLGARRPRTGNATAAERTVNRRIEIRVQSLSRQRQAALEGEAR
jgi:chemotaxis protein MotB